MANKRILKKHFAYVCGDLAAECIVASHLIKGVDADALNNLVTKIALLQDNSIKKINILFDKSISDFENAAEYRKARRKYFATAYTSLMKHFNDSVKEIIDEMNKALPKKK